MITFDCLHVSSGSCPLFCCYDSTDFTMLSFVVRFYALCHSCSSIFLMFLLSSLERNGEPNFLGTFLHARASTLDAHCFDLLYCRYPQNSSKLQKALKTTCCYPPDSEWVNLLRKVLFFGGDPQLFVAVHFSHEGIP